MIVVDTYVVAYLFIPGAYSETARSVYQQDPVWTSPLLWRSELRNVVLRWHLFAATGEQRRLPEPSGPPPPAYGP